MKKIMMYLVPYFTALLFTSCSLNEQKHKNSASKSDEQSELSSNESESKPGTTKTVGPTISVFSEDRFELAYRESNLRCDMECAAGGESDFVNLCTSKGGKVYSGSCCDKYCSVNVEYPWWKTFENKTVYDENQKARTYANINLSCHFNPFSNPEFLEKCFNQRGKLLPDENCAPTLCTADISTPGLARGPGNRYSDYIDLKTSIWKEQGGFPVLGFTP